MLSVSDLTVRYGMHEALTGVDLEVSRDEIVVMLGANGAGKSSLLAAIAGNCVGQVGGSVSLDGEALTGLDAAQVVERGIAYVPEGRGVFADLSVEENLQLGSYAEHARSKEQDSLRTVLSLFPKLEERKKQIVRTMSGGEQQMVAIGRALMSAPSILMLDEPSLGLSPLLCKELFGSLKQVRASGVGILLVEQNAKQSLGIADRGYLLGNGKIIGQDSAQQLLNDPNVQSAYLGGATTTTQTRKPAAQTSKPKVTVISDLIDKAEHQDEDLTKLYISPTSDKHRPQTVSADSLLAEDISALVQRAGSTATHRRDTDAALPMQVVKLTANPSHPGKGLNTKHGAHAHHNAKPRTNQTSSYHELPKTSDAAVQSLLDEFEVAAQLASNQSTAVMQSGANTTTKHKASSQLEDDDLPLPHIPVYKKSKVTVFRRDGSGNLRKQD